MSVSVFELPYSPYLTGDSLMNSPESAPSADFDAPFPTEQRGRETLRLLCVDDEPDVLRMVESLFPKSPQYNFRASESVESVESVTGDIDIAILDAVFDGMNQLELLLQLVRNRWPKCQIIFLTDVVVRIHTRDTEHITKKQFYKDSSLLRSAVMRAARKIRQIATPTDDLNLTNCSNVSIVEGRMEDPDHSADEVEVSLLDVYEDGSTEPHRYLMAREMFPDPSFLKPGAGFRVLSYLRQGKFSAEITETKVDWSELDAILNDPDYKALEAELDRRDRDQPEQFRALAEPA